MHSPYWRENLNKFLNGHHEVRYENQHMSYFISVCDDLIREIKENR